MKLIEDNKPMALIKSIHRYLFMLIILFILLFCFLPSVLTARVFIKTEVVSGQVISITKGNIIELDNDFSYYPAKKDITPSITPGETISIRYYIDDSYQRKYIDMASGKNSLKAVPIPKNATKSKEML